MDEKIYTAKILWQWRLQKGTKSKKKRVCEEQIVIFRSKNTDRAYKKLLKYIKSAELSMFVDDRQEVEAHYEFVGILDFFELDDWIEEEEFHEVWYDMYDRLLPMERKNKLVPDKEELRAYYSGKLPKRGRVKLIW